MALPDLATLDSLSSVASRLYRAGIFARDVNSDDKAFAVVLAGYDLGFSPTASARMLSIFHGKVLLSADAMVAVCMAKPDVCAMFRCVSGDDRAATYEARRVSHPSPERLTYTLEMAERAGLTSKNATWKSHPEAMLRARAASALARRLFPDLVAGLYDPAEFGDDTPAAPVEPAAPPPSTPSAYDAFQRDLVVAKSLRAVHAAWQEHARALADADATDTAWGAVGDWLGERGYCVVTTEQQAITSGAWGVDECALADELVARLAAHRSADTVLRWFLEAAPRVEALRDPRGFKTFVARTWGAQLDTAPKQPGRAFGAALESLRAEAAAAAAVEPGTPDEAQPEPITTSRGVVLDTRAAVEAHVRAIDSLKHAESAARKYGAHPWAVGALIDTVARLAAMHPDEADVLVAAWASDGVKGGA